MPAEVSVIAGALLLLLGRKLFWLFVALAGFYVGFEVAREVMAGQPQWMLWLAAAAAGLIGAIIALSCMLGAALVVSSLGLGDLGSVLAYAGLIAIGIIVQVRLMRGPMRPEARGEADAR
jgi:hypothetical protein